VLGVPVRELENRGTLPGDWVFPDLADLDRSEVRRRMGIGVRHGTNSASLCPGQPQAPVITIIATTISNVIMIIVITTLAPTAGNFVGVPYFLERSRVTSQPTAQDASKPKRLESDLTEMPKALAK